MTAVYKEREVGLNEYETPDDARRGIGGYLAATTTAPTRGSATAHPTSSAGPGRMDNDYRKPRPSLSTPAGSRSERFIERALSASVTCRLQGRSLFSYLAELITAHARGDPLHALA